MESGCEKVESIDLNSVDEEEKWVASEVEGDDEEDEMEGKGEGEGESDGEGEFDDEDEGAGGGVEGFLPALSNWENGIQLLLKLVRLGKNGSLWGTKLILETRIDNCDCDFWSGCREDKVPIPFNNISSSSPSEVFLIEDEVDDVRSSEFEFVFEEGVG